MSRMKYTEQQWHDEIAISHVQRFLERRYGAENIKVIKGGFETNDSGYRDTVLANPDLHDLRYDADLELYLPRGLKHAEIKTMSRSRRYRNFAIPHDGWEAAFNENIGRRDDDLEYLHRWVFLTFVTRDPADPESAGGIYACWPDQIPEPELIRVAKKPPTPGWPDWQDYHARLAAQYGESKIQLLEDSDRLDRNPFFTIPPQGPFSPGKSPAYLLPLGRFLDQIDQGLDLTLSIPIRPTRRRLRPSHSAAMPPPSLLAS